MSIYKLMKWLSPKVMVRTAACYRPSVVASRSYADNPEIPSSTKRAVGTLKEERLRVRRARPADTPRVLRFVKEHAAAAWPGVATHHSQNVVLDDLVTRTLAQGHSMIAEQQESKRWGQVRGVALSAAVSPWDANLLKAWAHCVRCTRSRRLVLFAAHCLSAPALHDKYQVHTVMQVVVIVPPDSPKASELARLLAKNALQRGRDTGFPVMRFDVTNESIEKSLQDLKLQKEWEFSYEVHPNAIKEFIPRETLNEGKTGQASSNDVRRNQITVYTAFPLRKS
ncbi:uncharacterized protein LOC111004297 [Pieris rapae]|uniref:uncharacterized protein LOC111004297 n=1 Tax=Pieris rapae TaxID=64459 RepID=UPI001E27C029|nr:uncharacterized protein LOC111004297 [Pieris rapae]